MLRARANEIADLVHRLGSRQRSAVDAARARLSVIGGRAVEDLIEALEGDDDRTRARVMPLLALIRDPRGRGPLIAMLLDTNPRLREIAAQCLGRFPSHETVAALARLLRTERRQRVRVAALRALVEQYTGGQEQAVPVVLERVSDVKEPRAARLAALALLPVLPPAGRRSLLRQLKRDPDPELRRAAEASESSDVTSPNPRATKIDELLVDVGSADYTIWNRAVLRLGACGAPAVRPSIDAMLQNARDPEYCTRTGMALKAMGPRRGRTVADSLDEIDEPLPLHTLVEVVGAFGEKALIYRLKDLIDRVARRGRSGAAVERFEQMQRVRARAHLELAGIGSRVAIQDLRDALGDPNLRVELDLLAAVRLIGKKDELGVLLRTYAREDEFVREELADVVRAIMKRERIRRNNRMFRTMSSAQLASLREILPRPTRPHARSRSSAPRAGAD